MIDDYYDRKAKKGVIGCLYSLTGIIVLGFLCLMYFLCGCTTTKYVPIKETHTEYVYVNQKDSTKDEYSHKESEKEKYISNTHTEERDSCSTTVDQQGNIIKQEHWHWSNTTNSEYIEREKALQDSIKHLHNKVDSLASEKVDSIPVPHPVEKKLTRWQQIKIDWGGWTMLVLVISIFIIIWLVIKKLQR